MYDLIDIAFRIKAQAKKRNIHVKDMLAACDLHANTVTQMAAGRVPLSTNLAKIADYLDCSVDYLLGRSTNPQSHK